MKCSALKKLLINVYGWRDKGLGYWNGMLYSVFHFELQFFVFSINSMITKYNPVQRRKY